MPHASELTVIHHDDTRTHFRDVRYQLHRHGVQIWAVDGEHAITDVLMTQAYRPHQSRESR